MAVKYPCDLRFDGFESLGVNDPCSFQPVPPISDRPLSSPPPPPRNASLCFLRDTNRISSPRQINNKLPPDRELPLDQLFRRIIIGRREKRLEPLIQTFPARVTTGVNFSFSKRSHDEFDPTQARLSVVTTDKEGGRWKESGEKRGVKVRVAKLL